MKYDKLVRDKIPFIIRKNGGKAKVRKAKKSEFEQRLKDKLVEEVKEFAESGNIEELADILEVIGAIVAHKKITWSQLEAIRMKKARERGTFKRRIILLKS